MRWLGALALAALAAGAGGGAAEEDAAPGAAHVTAARSLVAAVAAGDREAFESRFSRRVRGMQPDELWDGAKVLIGRFGAIEDVALGSVDEESGGAYVAVTFANARREVYVRLDDEGLIRQLLYVPPEVH